MPLTHPDQDGTPLLKPHNRPHWRYRYLCDKVRQAMALEVMLQQARIDLARGVRVIGAKKFKRLSELIKRFELVL